MTKLADARISLALRIGVPVAAAAVLAAACSSGGSSAGTAATASQSSPATASQSSPATGGRSSGSTVDVRTSDGASYLTDSSGRALYLWVPDTSKTSMCSGACAGAWPPLTTQSAPTAGRGANARDLATITRPDGTKQVTYDGHPLYYYAGDSGPGQTNGEGSTGFGAPWYLVAPSGHQIASL